MASLVLGAAGALVGSFFGPLGASIGWAVGSGLGNALFAKGTSGPRLTDLKLQSSSYGQMIPIEYGTVRISGIVIWQTDLVEHSQKSGGKGGPQVTSYTYSASFAVYLCEGPIGGVLRIWADSRLVYDSSVSQTTDFPFTLYVGTTTQEVDPTMEAAEGIGMVPAHRGIAYVVFTDFFLTDYGNRIPSLTFEVFSLGGPIPWVYSLFAPVNEVADFGGGPQSGMLENGQLILGLWTENAGAGPTYQEWKYDLQGNLLVTEDPVNGVNMPVGAGGVGTRTEVRPCYNNPRVTFGRRSAAGFANCAGFYYAGTLAFSGTSYTISASYCVYSNDAVFTVGTIDSTNLTMYLTKWSAPGGVVVGQELTYILPPPGGSAALYTLAVDDTGDVWVLNGKSTAVAGDHLFHFDSDLNLIRSWAFVDLPNSHLAHTTEFTVWNGIIAFSDNIGAQFYAYYINANGTFTLADPGTVVASPAVQYANSISLGNGLVLTRNGIVSLQPQANAVTLASIVADLSVRSDLTTDQIDVTELTDLVDGYVIGNQTDSRSCIEPLQVAWPFDAVEHDVLVRFPRRGLDGLIATIDDNDLGAFVPPGDPPALMTTQRIQENDLPRIVDATFLNKDTDYQNGEARAQRLITSSELKTALQLPIVMDSVKGQDVANVTLYQAWIEREHFGLSLPRKWILLEPGDVIQADGRTMRITRKVEQADGIVKIDAVAMSLSVYLHSAPAAEGVGMPGGGGTPPTSPPVLQDTDLILLDLPLIKDTDAPVGFYAAMNGHTQPSWPGATIYKSIDGGMSFNPEITDTVADTFGDCSTILGDFTGGNIVDEINSLTVVLNAGSGTLSSITNLGLLNGGNKAVVGTPGTTGIRQIEIIQFRDATLIAANTYTLTGLLRGRRGSEWMMGSHVASEKFVLLPTSTNILGDPAELFLSREYRAVTSGRALSTSAIQDFTNYGIAALPYAPCNLGGGREVNGDLTITWIRRTRIGGMWMPFADVPLGETVEQYQIRIYTDGTYSAVARVDTIIDATQYTYTAANQATDFGSPSPVPVYVGISQLGTFSYGYELRGGI